MQEPEITLASASPRRLELMELTGLQVTIAAAEIDESPQAGEGPREMTMRLALAKAKAARATTGLVLGADTVVVSDGELLGKPSDRETAIAMLKSLRGRPHQVVTSIALLDLDSGLEVTDSCESSVPMRGFTDMEMNRYIESGDPYDKAGSYAIQDRDFSPVDVSRMQDCYANVMGLPLCHVVRNLPQANPENTPKSCQAHTGYDCPIYQEVLERRL